MAIDERFWITEAETLAAILLKHLFGASVQGAQSAMDALMDKWAVGVDWGLVNQAALEWAKRISPELAGTITETSRRFVTHAMSDWISSGRPKAELIDTLAPMFGKVRAQMIGTTEITRAYFEGNKATWQESGVVDGFKWMTARDEIVCPICGELDGQEFTFADDGPPAHVNCRCYAQPVVTI